jgi:hypothetical protein
MSSAHWAWPLIGQPWSPARNCWWLMREFFRMRHGLEMPVVAVGELGAGESENVAAIKLAARSSGWRPVLGMPSREDDLVVMEDAYGRRHVGVAIQVDGRLLILHNAGSMGPAGPTGGVVAQRLPELIDDGFKNMVVWRRAC